MLMKRALTFLFFLLTAAVALAQPPRRVDSTASYANVPAFYTTSNGKLYYTAESQTTGRTLWEYDEVAKPKPTYGTIGISAAGVDHFASLNGKIYYRDATTGGLVAYNGVSAPVAVNMGATGATNPHDIIAYNGKLYFAGARSASTDLLVSDGINPPVVCTQSGTATTGGIDPRHLVAANGKIFMAGKNAAGVVMLHMLDTATRVISEVPASGLYPEFIAAAGCRVYYRAWSAANGYELWQCKAGVASRITDLAPGTQDGMNIGLAYLKGKVYFGGSVNGAFYQLYAVDTATNTPALALTINAAGDGQATGQFIYHNKVWFMGYNPATGREFWRYDGTTGGIVADLLPGAGSGEDIDIPSVGILNDHLYAGGDDGVHGVELWRYEDTSGNATTTPTTGLSSIRFDGSVSVYPNPAGDAATAALSLPLAQSLSITLSNAGGQQVFSTGLRAFPTGRSAVNLPMQAFAAGQYFYRVSGSDGRLLNCGAVQKL